MNMLGFLKENELFFLKWNDDSQGVFEFKNNIFVEIEENEGFGRAEIDIEHAFTCIELRKANKEEIESVKPKETFIDVEIDWNPIDEPTVKHPNNTNWTLNALSLRAPVNGWFINKYIFKDLSTCIYPVKTDGDKCFDKATHARFVKVGE